jgi:hypothetical protein
MDHILSELGLRLVYLRGRSAIDALDQERVLDELLDGTPITEEPVWAGRRFLSDYDHLLLAYNLTTGATLGIAGAHDRRADDVSFLWLETGFVAENARGRNLMRRMIALLLLRVASFGTVPDCLATVTRNPVAIHVLRDMVRRLVGVGFAPVSEGPVVDLGRFRLVRAVGRGLGQPVSLGGASRGAWNGLMMHGLSSSMPRPMAELASEPMLGVLDLREAPEAALIADLRKLYRDGRVRASRILAAKSRVSPDPSMQAHENPVGEIAAS